MAALIFAQPASCNRCGARIWNTKKSTNISHMDAWLCGRNPRTAFAMLARGPSTSDRSPTLSATKLSRVIVSPPRASRYFPNRHYVRRVLKPPILPCGRNGLRTTPVLCTVDMIGLHNIYASMFSENRFGFCYDICTIICIGSCRFNALLANPPNASDIGAEININQDNISFPRNTTYDRYQHKHNVRHKVQSFIEQHLHQLCDTSFERAMGPLWPHSRSVYDPLTEENK